MFHFLSKPYPRTNEIKVWLPVILLAGSLVAVILFFVFSFQNDLQISMELIRNLALFGLVTVLCISFTQIGLPFLFKAFFAEEKWTVLKNIFVWLVTLLLIAAGNMWMANILYGDTISAQNFLVFLYYTLGIGFVVNAILTSLNYRRLTNKFKTAAALMTEEIKLHHHDDVPAGFQSSASKDKSSKIIITSESEKETLEFFIDDLLYIESADNYSRIFYTKKSKESSIIIRSSLKRIETQANHVDLFRCHRAYIVNLKKIGSVKGNSQGYRLKVNDTEKEIPVSRNSGKELSERLKNLS